MGQRQTWREIAFTGYRSRPRYSPKAALARTCDQLPGLLNIARGRLIEILLPDEVLEAIRQHVRRAPAGIEQGGLLLGYRKQGAVQVHSATFPGQWDHGSPTVFRRSARGHRIRAMKEWIKSRRTVDWVGEWHTHPGGIARPSFVDRRSWAALVRHTGKPMVFLIFDDRKMFVGLQMPHALGFVELEALEQNEQTALYGPTRWH